MSATFAERKATLTSTLVPVSSPPAAFFMSSDLEKSTNGISYGRVWLTFAQNSLIREMTFRTNFLLDCVSSMCWTLMNVGFYLVIFQHVNSIGSNSGWGQAEFFVFLGTTWIINSLMQAFVMPNAEEFSELIRTGGLDFALLKPIDTQFLISFRKINWAALTNIVIGVVLLVVAMTSLPWRESHTWQLAWYTVPLYLLYIGCGFVMLYSLMICLASTSIWLGRNQSLYDFWFYITNFSRYPMEIYQSGWGLPLWAVFTFVVPVLVVVNIPARILAQPITPASTGDWLLAVYTLVASVTAYFLSRLVFRTALVSYRSASS